MIYVTRPHLPDRARLDSYLDRVYGSNQLTNNGPLLRELTERLENYLGVTNLLLVANGTIALQLALRLLKIEGRVITTPFSFPATTSAIIWQGAQPVFADIDAETFNVDPAEVAAGLEEPAGGMLVTHVYGNPCDVDALDQLAKKANVPLIYDAAQAFGVRGATSVLLHGDISILSLHATKIFHTLEGGALVIRDDALFEEAERMINFGFGDGGEILGVGINGKMNEFEAAMGLAMLDEIQYIQEGLKRVYSIYEENLPESLLRPRWHSGYSRSHSYCPVLFDSESTLLRVQARLHEHEIYPRRYFRPSLDTVDVYGHPGNCEVSQDIVNRILCLPQYAALEDQQVLEICGLIHSVTD